MSHHLRSIPALFFSWRPDMKPNNFRSKREDNIYFNIRFKKIFQIRIFENRNIEQCSYYESNLSFLDLLQKQQVEYLIKQTSTFQFLIFISWIQHTSSHFIQVIFSSGIKSACTIFLFLLAACDKNRAVITQAREIGPRAPWIP